MALIKCPECGANNVSDNATACPHCGYKLTSHKRKENIKDNINKFNQFLYRKSTKLGICILIMITAIFFGVSFFKKAQYREFSGEYSVRSIYNDNLPNVIHFDEDGTGHYFVNMKMYIFDYTLTSDTVEIDTHEQFLPIYTAELDVVCTRTEDGFLIGNIKVEKRK